MRRGPPILTILVGLAALGTAVGGQTGKQTGQLALIGGTIYTDPAGEPIRDGVVLIRDGVIAAVGSSASVRMPSNIQTLDCSGLTIAAGFWNSHVHFAETKWSNVAAIPAQELDRQLQDTITRHGFTSVFDIGSMSANTRRLRERIESGEVPGPRIRSTGEVLLAPGAVPPDAVLRALGFMTYPSFEIMTAAQAAAASRKLLDAGADGIKVHLQLPPPPGSPFPESAVQAVVIEAHRAGKPVFVHPNSSADVLVAVQAGADVIAHTTPSSGPWTDTILAAMKKQAVALTPTLAVWKSLLRHDRISAQEQAVTTATGQLKAWVGSGGAVLFGNDLGAVDYDPGEEYRLMAEAGMSVRAILASLTTVPAERFWASTRLGRIAPGFTADLTILSGDPSKDVRALAAVQYALRDGKIVYRAPR